MATLRLGADFLVVNVYEQEMQQEVVLVGVSFIYKCTDCGGTSFSFLVTMKQIIFNNEFTQEAQEASHAQSQQLFPQEEYNVNRVIKINCNARCVMSKQNSLC